MADGPPGLASFGASGGGGLIRPNRIRRFRIEPAIDNQKAQRRIPMQTLHAESAYAIIPRLGKAQYVSLWRPTVMSYASALHPPYEGIKQWPGFSTDTSPR